MYEDIHALMVKHDEELSLVLWNHDLPHRSMRVLQRSLNITDEGAYVYPNMETDSDFIYIPDGVIKEGFAKGR